MMIGNWSGGNRCGGWGQQPTMQQPQPQPQYQPQWPQWGGGMSMGGSPWFPPRPMMGGWGQNNGYSPQWNQGVNQLQQNGVIPFNTGQYKPQSMPQSMPVGHNNLFDYARSTGALRGLFG